MKIVSIVLMFLFTFPLLAQDDTLLGPNIKQRRKRVYYVREFRECEPTRPETCFEIAERQLDAKEYDKAYFNYKLGCMNSHGASCDGMARIDEIRGNFKEQERHTEMGCKYGFIPSCETDRRVFWHWKLLLFGVDGYYFNQDDINDLGAGLSWRPTWWWEDDEFKLRGTFAWHSLQNRTQEDTEWTYGYELTFLKAITPSEIYWGATLGRKKIIHGETASLVGLDGNYELKIDAFPFVSELVVSYRYMMFDTTIHMGSISILWTPNF